MKKKKTIRFASYVLIFMLVLGIGMLAKTDNTYAKSKVYEKIDVRKSSKKQHIGKLYSP